MTRILEKFPFHPILIAVYPVAYLLSGNIGDVGVGAGLRAGLILIGTAMLAFLFSLLVTRDLRKSGIMVLVMILVFFLIFFLLYAPLYHWLRDVRIFGEVLGRHRYLVPLTVFLILSSGLISHFLLRRSKPKILRRLTFSLNTLSIILILIPLVGIISGVIRKQTTATLKPEALPPLAEMTIADGTAPDIYLIVLDMHVSDTALKNLTGYEDPAFSAGLQDRGFYVAGCSRSNYPVTQHSLTSELNMDYLDELTGSTETGVIYQYMQSSRVQRTLEAAGYRTLAFETGFSFTDLVSADEFLSPVGSASAWLAYPGISPFESLILQISGGKILYETRDQLSRGMQYAIDAAYVEYRDRILYDLDTLPVVAQEVGPKFVFAHILAPHPPFVFDRDGNFIYRMTPFSLNMDPEGYDFYEFSDAYYEELLYLHQRILGVVDEILRVSETPPIIIIQGDHGIPRTAHRNAQYEIYTAIHMGGANSDALYSTISPVNTFRVIFNQLYGTDYELLPDETYIINEDEGTHLQFDGVFNCP
jgi:hypothetical protein